MGAVRTYTDKATLRVIRRLGGEEGNGGEGGDGGDGGADGGADGGDGGADDGHGGADGQTISKFEIQSFIFQSLTPEPPQAPGAGQ